MTQSHNEAPACSWDPGVGFRYPDKAAVGRFLFTFFVSLMRAGWFPTRKMPVGNASGNVPQSGILHLVALFLHDGVGGA